MTIHKWIRPEQRSLNNLHVLVVHDKEVGFIHKPKDSKTDKNSWRVYRGIGEKAQFMHWTTSKMQAMTSLEQIFVGVLHMNVDSSITIK